MNDHNLIFKKIIDEIYTCTGRNIQRIFSFSFNRFIHANCEYETVSYKIHKSIKDPIDDYINPTQVKLRSAYHRTNLFEF